MGETDLQRIRHILLHCEDIEKSLQRHSQDFDEFLDDHEFYNSICMDTLQIGELSGGLSPVFKNESSDIVPWVSIRAVRNIVAHAYETVKSKTLWEIATQDIPALQRFCEQTIAEAENT